MSSQPFLAGIAQVAPSYFNLHASIKIAEQWIAKAGKKGIKLLVFPETWLPGYPFWLDDAPKMGLWDYAPTKKIFRALFENSIEVPSVYTQQLGAAAQKAGLSLVMGINERDGNTLYNTIIYFDTDGRLLGKHRKLIPTFTERMIWGRGDGSTLAAFETTLGRVGGLVCWEHWMPLARQTMHQQQEIVHAALWPTVKEMLLVASRAYAFEGRTYVLAAGTPLYRKDLPQGFELLDNIQGEGPFMHGGSAIIAPDGTILAGPAGGKEELLIAEIDPGRIIEESMALDICGHYARPDVFNFSVNDFDL